MSDDESDLPLLVSMSSGTSETDSESDTDSDTESDSLVEASNPKLKYPKLKSALASEATSDDKNEASNGDAEIAASAAPAVTEPPRSKVKPPAMPPPRRVLDLSCWNDVVQVKWNRAETIDWPMLEEHFITRANAIADSDRATAGRDDDYEYDGDSSTSDEEDIEIKAASSGVPAMASASAVATAAAPSVKIQAPQLSEHARNWFAHASEIDRLRFQRKMDFIAEFTARAKAGHASETNIGRTKKMKGCKKVNLWRTKLDKGWVQSRNVFMRTNAKVCNDTHPFLL